MRDSLKVFNLKIKTNFYNLTILLIALNLLHHQYLKMKFKNYVLILTMVKD